MESFWIHCEHMHGLLYSSFLRLADRGNCRQKRRPIRVQCGKRSKRCFPMSERRDLLICSSTVDSSHEKSSIFAPRNGVMYVKSIALNAISWSVYFVMPIS